MGDKKRGFWWLLFFFGLMAVLSLAVNWQTATPGDPELGMSMGGMMNRHHLTQLTPESLLSMQGEQHPLITQSGQHVSPLIAGMGFFSTLTVFLALPLMLGGAVMLVVLWY